MGDGQDPDRLIVDDVGDVVGEYPEINPAVIVAPDTRKLRVACDPIDDRFGLLLESDAQARLDGFLARDRIIQFRLRLLKDSQNHEGYLASSSLKASPSGLERADPFLTASARAAISSYQADSVSGENSPAGSETSMRIRASL